MIKNTANIKSHALLDYVTCEYMDGTRVTFGKVSEKCYSLSVVINKDASSNELITNLVLPENIIIGIVTVLLTHAKIHYIDLNEKMKELIEKGHLYCYNP